MSPGLGKTFTSLHDWYYNGKQNLIVLTLTSLLTSWEIESKLMEFPTPIEVKKLNKGSSTSMKDIKKDIESGKRVIYIISYQTSWRMEEILLLNKQNYSLVFDESHKVKNRSSKQTKFAIKLVNKFDNVRLLTGTPMSIGWEDYFVSLKLLGEIDPRVKTLKAFKKNFMIIENKSNFSSNSMYEVVVGYKNIESLKEIINKTSIFMDEKSADIILPEQNEKTYYLEQDKDFLKAMKDKVYGNWMIKNSGSKLMAFRTGLSGFVYGEDKFGDQIVEKFPKQPRKELFRDIVSSIDKKVLVFYNFIQEREDIKDVAEKLEKKISFITKDKIDLSGDIIATHYISGSTGHNLQEINNIIYYSPTITGSDFIQSKKRIHRIGQNKNCFYYYLINLGSVEERILEKIKMNEDYTEEMFEKEEQ